MLTIKGMEIKIIIKLTREGEKSYLYTMPVIHLILMTDFIVRTKFNRRIDVIFHGNMECSYSRLPLVCEGQAVIET